MQKGRKSSCSKKEQVNPQLDGPLKTLVDEIVRIKRDVGNLSEELKRAKGILERNKDLVQQKAEGNTIVLTFNDDSQVTGKFIRQTHYNISLEIDGKEKVIFKHAIKYFEAK